MSPPTKRPVRISATERLLNLFSFDQQYLQAAPSGACIIGIDEVGRGSLIGPVVAAAVCFPHCEPDGFPEGFEALNDSKKVSPQKREVLERLIKGHSAFYVAEASQAEIDEINIHQASLLAARRAFTGLLKQLPQHLAHIQLLMDGRQSIPDLVSSGVELSQSAIIKGDGQSAHIAAASILAKEARDRWVKKQAIKHPHYQWQSNMGYATQAHREAIARLGRSPLHRQSFQVK